MPGLIDSHIHTVLALLRGLSQDINEWMEKGLWPFVEQLNYEDMKLGSMINIIEGVKAGTTTFCDYDSNMDLILHNHAELGTRARAADFE